MLTKKNVSVDKGLLVRVAEYVSKKYDLGDEYEVTKFDSKPNKLIIGMCAEDLELTVTIKGTVFYMLTNSGEVEEEE